MSAIDQVFARAQSGDLEGFADWVRLVEIPLWKGLRRFARVADSEAVVQEALLRMWRLAPSLTLDGENASLRFALVLARNIAKDEARRAGRMVPLEDAEPPVPIDPDPPSDPGLRAAIRRCLEKLSGRPREALQSRLRQGARLPDRDLAELLGMTLNTFLQNITRARKLMARCLAEQGVSIGGHTP